MWVFSFEASQLSLEFFMFGISGCGLSVQIMG